LLKNLDGYEADGRPSELLAKGVLLPPQLHAEGAGSDLACKQSAQLLDQLPGLKDQKKKLAAMQASMTRADEYYGIGDIGNGFGELQKTLESIVLETLPELETHELSDGKIRVCSTGIRCLFFLVRLYRSYSLDATDPKTLFRALSLGFVAKVGMRLQREWYGSLANGVKMPSTTGIKLTELTVFLGFGWHAKERLSSSQSKPRKAASRISNS
jgi:hypothetical protein